VDDKGPTPEKMKSLKEALSVAMKAESRLQRDEVPLASGTRIPTQPPKFATPPKKADTKTEPKARVKAEVPLPSGEVPEETLKKILE